MGDVTVLLHRIAENDRAALDALFELLHGDIHRMARARLHEHGPETLLDTTSLANEAYLKLQAAGRIDLDSRGRFMAYVSQVLRNVLRRAAAHCARVPVRTACLCNARAGAARRRPRR